MSTRYNPALACDWLTGLYDPVMRRIMREHTFKTELIRQAEIVLGDSVLDLGCGTATLTALLNASTWAPGLPPPLPGRQGQLHGRGFPSLKARRAVAHG